MVAKGNKRSDLQPLAEQVLAAVAAIQPGQLVRIGG